MLLLPLYWGLGKREGAGGQRTKGEEGRRTCGVQVYLYDICLVEVRDLELAASKVYIVFLWIDAHARRDRRQHLVILAQRVNHHDGKHTHVHISCLVP